MPAVSCHPFRHGKYRMNISGSRLLGVLEKWLPWIVAALITGCAHYPENVRLDEYNQEEGYRFANLNYEDNAGDWLVVATFSGGGTRAAALAYGVLEQMASTEISSGGQKKRLLDELDVISSVSGGSLTAAYYAIHQDGIFRDFESAFLKRNAQEEISRRFLRPSNLVRMASPAYGRINLVAEYFDETLFNGATYGTLLRSGHRPFVLINASDMSLGARFEFTQDQFDLLCSDLSRFPVARAVAASSAVPVIFSPLTLKNYAGQCGYTEPAWVAGALHDRASSVRQYNKAAELRSYLNAPKRPFIHLLDGGMTDNLGLRGLLDRIISSESSPGMPHLLRARPFRKAILIVVSAETGPDFSQDLSERVPTLSQVVRAIKDVPINRYSFETSELLKSSMGAWARRIGMGGHPPDGQGSSNGVDTYVIEVSFDALRDDAERQLFMSIPTSFNLPPETVDSLRRLAARLMIESPDYQRLLRDLGS